MEAGSSNRLNFVGRTVYFRKTSWNDRATAGTALPVAISSVGEIPYVPEIFRKTQLGGSREKSVPIDFGHDLEAGKNGNRRSVE